MKISELIKQAELACSKHGDIDVKVFDVETKHFYPCETARAGNADDELLFGISSFDDYMTFDYVE
jgi:hypothetical protein